MKKIICIICGGILSFWSLIFGIVGVIILTDSDVQQGKIGGCIISLIIGFVLGFGAWKLFCRVKKSHGQLVETYDLITESAPVLTASIQKQDIPQQVLQGELQIKKFNKIPLNVMELLWIKNNQQMLDNSLLNEPSLIDLGLEIKQSNTPIEDIGYYPSYKNLTPEKRFVYLKWLCDVTKPIPIGYVFIFYYGLERHLIYGKFEEAFDMIVKLRNYHNNKSFFAYSSDALLIAALYHKREDLISKIDLNKATPKLAQFIIAALTGKIDCDLMIANAKDVGFVNDRYIKMDRSLFINTLEKILQREFGDTFYPIEEKDFLQCKQTFPLVLANYSLKMNERIANAPDITTNPGYCQKVFDILNETHETIKEIKKKERMRK